MKVVVELYRSSKCDVVERDEFEDKKIGEKLENVLFIREAYEANRWFYKKDEIVVHFNCGTVKILINDLNSRGYSKIKIYEDCKLILEKEL